MDSLLQHVGLPLLYESYGHVACEPSHSRGGQSFHDCGPTALAARATSPWCTTFGHSTLVPTLCFYGNAPKVSLLQLAGVPLQFVAFEGHMGFTGHWIVIVKPTYGGSKHALMDSLLQLVGLSLLCESCGHALRGFFFCLLHRASTNSVPPHPTATPPRIPCCFTAPCRRSVWSSRATWRPRVASWRPLSAAMAMPSRMPCCSTPACRWCTSLMGILRERGHVRLSVATIKLPQDSLLQHVSVPLLYEVFECHVNTAGQRDVIFGLSRHGVRGLRARCVRRARALPCGLRVSRGHRGAADCHLWALSGTGCKAEAEHAD